MRRQLSRIGGILAAGLAIVTLSSGVVVAQPEQLSPADAEELQRQIDEQLSKAPGGVQISANEVAYDDGAVIVAFPLPGQIGPEGLTPTFAERCPANHICLFDGKNWTGAMVAYHYEHQFHTPQYNSLHDRGFNDRAESWANLTRFDARWFQHTRPWWGDSRCMDAGTVSSATFGRNRISSFVVYTDDRACKAGDH